MIFGVNIVYLLILVAVSLGFILGVRALQKAVLSELSRTLYEENDPGRYASMLNSRYLFLVLRRGTVALLRLDGALFAASADAVWQACAVLDSAKLKQEERLNWYQKALSFAVMQADEQHAKDYLDRIVSFLERESNEELKAIRAEAGQLYGVYMEKNTGLISELEETAAGCDGARLGVVLYRLAKLYHFAGDEAGAARRLKKAVVHLRNSPWLDVAERALLDPSVLDVE